MAESPQVTEENELKSKELANYRLAHRLHSKGGPWRAPDFLVGDGLAETQTQNFKTVRVVSIWQVRKQGSTT